MCEDVKVFDCTHAIFDMDGVILDTEIIYEAIINKVLEPYNVKLSKKVNAQRKGLSGKDLVELLIQKYKLPITGPELREKLLALYPAYLPNTELIPGAEKLINHLYDNKIPIAVATSSSQFSYDLKTQNHTKLFSKFHHKVLAGTDPEIKYGKPAPDTFLICAERFEEKPLPCSCVVFEDSPNGILAANAAGMHSIMLPDVDVAEKDVKLATVILKSFDDFRPDMFGFPPFPKEEVKAMVKVGGGESGKRNK